MLVPIVGELRNAAGELVVLRLNEAYVVLCGRVRSNPFRVFREHCPNARLSVLWFGTRLPNLFLLSLDYERSS